MKKLNNKGLTAIEILVCFAIISVIVIAMFNIVNNYKDKQSLESYKSSINTYKTTVTAAINDDIIKNYGIVSYSSTQTGDSNTNPEEENTFEYIIYLAYESGKTATIVIHNESRCFTDDNGVKTYNQDCTDENSDNIDSENSKYYISFTDSTEETDKFSLPNVYHLKFNDIVPKETDGIINIKVGLWHPDLGTKYDVLNIITPNVNIYPGMLG